MSDAVTLVLIPLALVAYLTWLRGRRPLFWWLSLAAYAILVCSIAVLRSTDSRQALGAAILFLLPVGAMFVGLRPKLFLRRRGLIPPAGIALYLLGLVVSAGDIGNTSDRGHELNAVPVAE